MMHKKLYERDAEEMASLLSNSFSQSSWDQSSLKKFLSLDTCEALGYVEDSLLTGFILVQISSEEAEILLLVTHPFYRRQGTASSLLGSIEESLETSKIKKFFLEVSIENEAAISFYEKHGFKNVGVRKNYYSRKENKSANVMVKNIKC